MVSKVGPAGQQQVHCLTRRQMQRCASVLVRAFILSLPQSLQYLNQAARWALVTGLMQESSQAPE
jgi:hypothetical protein